MFYPHALRRVSLPTAPEISIAQGEQSRSSRPISLGQHPCIPITATFCLASLSPISLANPCNDLYIDSIFKPLGLTYTNSSVPPKAEFARSVIPGGDPIAAVFDLDGGISIPAGGLFSTVNDLAKVGVSILNSTLLPSNVTRKWMKPVSQHCSLAVCRRQALGDISVQAPVGDTSLTSTPNLVTVATMVAIWLLYQNMMPASASSAPVCRRLAVRPRSLLLIFSPRPCCQRWSQKQDVKQERNIAGTYVSSTKGAELELDVGF